MKRFYIKYVAASGEKVKFSKVEFSSGMNIIHGPSNTGKSYVLGCVSFMFGRDIPFTRVSTGYDTISIRFENDDGEYVFAERKIVDGKNGERGDNSVKITASAEGFESGKYSIRDKTYSDLLMRLIGVDKRHKIIAKQNGTQNDLTMRSLFHFFYLDEDNIFSKQSPFYPPGYSNPTPSLSSLLFLLDGRDYQDILPQESAAEREKKAIQKTGVILYLNAKIQELTLRRAEIEQAVAQMGNVDVEAAMDSVIKEIDAIDRQIVIASEESRELVEQIYTASSRLEEAYFLQDRYKSLHSQYASDIRRLQFITDGERKRSNIHRLVVCPFCDQEMADNSDERESYLAASDVELKRVKYQMRDLEQAQRDISAEIIALEKQIKALEEKNEEVIKVLNQNLRPRATELKNTVVAYRGIVLQQREIYAMETMAAELNTDAFNQASEDEDPEIKFEPRKVLGNSDHWSQLSNSFDEMVRDCVYPGKPVARIDIDTCDPVVNGKHKRDEGKGYRAFLNTIMLFNLMRYLSSYGTYAPRFLLLDSPILSLKEKKKDITEQEKATPGMRESLFRYMVTHCDGNQVIISENELPEGVDYSSAHLIEFTQEEDSERYGFLLTKPIE